MNDYTLYGRCNGKVVHQGGDAIHQCTKPAIHIHGFCEKHDRMSKGELYLRIAELEAEVAKLRSRLALDDLLEERQEMESLATGNSFD